MDRLQLWFNWLTASPLEFLIYMVFLLTTVLISITLHELAHGYVAYRCGDPTAKMLGRLTLNPIKHLDPFGTIFLLLFGFGWAKPVPVNPRNFNNYRRDDLAVSLAGIVVNITLFIVSIALCVGLNRVVFDGETLFLQRGILEANYMGFSMNGASLASLSAQPILFYVQLFFSMFASINIGLGLFNLLPIPPLDGFHVLNDIVLKGKISLSGEAFRIAQMAMMLILFSGILNGVLSGMINGVYSTVLNFFLLITGQA